jgi:hypothetical protein
MATVPKPTQATGSVTRQALADPAPTPERVLALAQAGGIVPSDAAAQRIANAIAPACRAFAAVRVDLPFAAEPADYIRLRDGEEHR